jgi:predicted esterase
MLSPFLHSDGRLVYVRESNVGASHWVVFLPGSSAELWDFGWGEIRALLEPLKGKANLLQVNKPGIGADGSVNKREFEKSFRRSQRVKDYAEILRECIPSQHKIFLLGFSEGAYLGPEVALRDKRTRALALICGGTRSWLDEEIYKPCALNLRPIFQRVGQVYARPHSTTLKWHGNSHATWISYDNDDTLRALEKLALPVLAMHASEDIMIDNDSATADLLRLKREGKDITLRMFEGVDHTLERHWLKALRAAGTFFHKNLRSSGAHRWTKPSIFEKPRT